MNATLRTFLDKTKFYLGRAALFALAVIVLVIGLRLAGKVIDVREAVTCPFATEAPRVQALPGEGVDQLLQRASNYGSECNLDTFRQKFYTLNGTENIQKDGWYAVPQEKK